MISVEYFTWNRLFVRVIFSILCTDTSGADSQQQLETHSILSVLFSFLCLKFVQIEYKIIIIMFFSENLISLILTLRADNPNYSDKIALAIPKLFNC